MPPIRAFWGRARVRLQPIAMLINAEIRAAFTNLSTPLVADAALRLGVPLGFAPPGIRPLLAGMRVAGWGLPARHYGSVDVFLEALQHSQAGDVIGHRQRRPACRRLHRRLDGVGSSDGRRGGHGGLGRTPRHAGTACDSATDLFLRRVAGGSNTARPPGAGCAPSRSCRRVCRDP